MASAIAKRKTSALQDGPRQKNPRITTAQLQTGSSAVEISFNKLCSVCEKIFARFSRERKYTFSWFHDLVGLFESASNGCHSCSLIKADMRSNRGLTEEIEREWRRMKEEEPDVAPKPLKAETRYLWETGVSFLLRFEDAAEHDVSANIDFLFENALSKSSETHFHYLRIDLTIIAFRHERPQLFAFSTHAK
jgi:hypothetical protein